MIPTPGDVKGNVEKALRYCDKAASRGVKILCFPECASTGWESGWLNEKACRSKFYGGACSGPNGGPIQRKGGGDGHVYHFRYGGKTTPLAKNL